MPDWAIYGEPDVIEAKIILPKECMKIDTTTLRAQTFFKGLSASCLKILVDEAMPAEFKAGEEIFDEGGPANRFYLICSGNVQLESPTDSEHAPLIVETIG